MSAASAPLKTGIGTSGSRMSWIWKALCTCARTFGDRCGMKRSRWTAEMRGAEIMAFAAVWTRTARETEMMCIRKLAVAGLMLVAGGFAALAQTPIKVSYQPALYWSLPYYVASEKGFWAEAGL